MTAYHAPSTWHVQPTMHLVRGTGDVDRSIVLQGRRFHAGFHDDIVASSHLDSLRRGRGRPCYCLLRNIFLALALHAIQAAAPPKRPSRRDATKKLCKHAKSKQKDSKHKQRGPRRTRRRRRKETSSFAQSASVTHAT